MSDWAWRGAGDIKSGLKTGEKDGAFDGLRSRTGMLHYLVKTYEAVLFWTHGGGH